MGNVTVLLTLLLLALVSPHVVEGSNGKTPCGKRCILNLRTGKWECKPVSCRPCYACIYKEKCRVRLLGFKCCGRVGFCFKCPNCNCGGLRKGTLVQSVQSEPEGCASENCEIPTVDDGGPLPPPPPPPPPGPDGPVGPE